MPFGSHRIKLSFVPLVAVALLVGACADQGAPSGRLIGPEQTAYSRGGVKKLRQVDLANPAPLAVTATVGPSGEFLRAGNYFLLVPAGAVRRTTTFTMDVATDGVVSLTAFQTRANGTRVDVGVVGFHKKLTLALHYGNSAEAIANPQNLRVGWLQSNGSLSPVASSVSPESRLVYGQLSHFSAYAIATED